MKKIAGAMVASSVLIFAQAASLPSPSVNTSLVNAQSYSASSKPIILHVDMYNLETKSNIPQDALSVADNRLDIVNKLGQFGAYKMVSSSSVSVLPDKPIQKTSVKLIPYTGDCSFEDGKAISCRALHAEIDYKMSMTPTMGKDGTFMLDSDLTYLDIVGYSKFEFEGEKLEIPKIQENRQKRSSVSTGEHPVVLIDKKDDINYRIAVISVEWPKEQR